MNEFRRLRPKRRSRSRSRSFAIPARRTTTGPVETHRGRRRRHRNTQGDRHKGAGVPGGVKRRERQQAVLAPSQPLPARTYRWQPAAFAPRSLIGLTRHFSRGIGNRRFPPRPGTAFRRLATPLPARPPGDVDSEVREGRRLPRSHHRSRKGCDGVWRAAGALRRGQNDIVSLFTHPGIKKHH